jgi:hypothetical protein
MVCANVQVSKQAEHGWSHRRRAKEAVYSPLGGAVLGTTNHVNQHTVRPHVLLGHRGHKRRHRRAEEQHLKGCGDSSLGHAQDVVCEGMRCV